VWRPLVVGIAVWASMSMLAGGLSDVFLPGLFEGDGIFNALGWKQPCQAMLLANVPIDVLEYCCMIPLLKTLLLLSHCSEASYRNTLQTTGGICLTRLLQSLY